MLNTLTHTRCLTGEVALKESVVDVKTQWNRVHCALNEASTAIENNSKTLKGLYSSVAMLQRETVEKTKCVVRREDISSDITTVREHDNSCYDDNHLVVAMVTIITRPLNSCGNNIAK